MSYLIGHNMVGYLPEDMDDPFYYETYAEAAESLASMMREYADDDDELSSYGDESTAMLPVVESVLTDDHPLTGTDNNGWGCIIEDNSYHRIAFWLVYSDEPATDPGF
jgi:hypothetical protein